MIKFFQHILLSSVFILPPMPMHVPRQAANLNHLVTTQVNEVLDPKISLINGNIVQLFRGVRFVLETPLGSLDNIKITNTLIPNDQEQSKELIHAQLPNVSGGSSYRWRVEPEDPLAQITFKENSDGTVDVIEELYPQIKTVGRIEPFAYWTAGGQEKFVAMRLETNQHGQPTISINIQETQSNYPLTIDPSISYGQWLGEGTSPATTIKALAVEPGSGEIYAGGSASGMMTIGGTNYGTFKDGPFGYSDGFVVEMTSGNPPTINWVYLLGGNNIDSVNALAVNGEEIYVGGDTRTISSWNTAGSTVGTFGGNASDAFVIEIADGATPSLNWRAVLGSSSSDTLNALVVNADEIYAAGTSFGSDSWDTFGSTLGTMTNNTAEGFVFELGDGGPPTLNWIVFFGGVGADYGNGLAVNGDSIYAGGYSVSSDTWDTFGSSVGTWTNTAVDEGFVVEITDGGPPTMGWNMWLGGVGNDDIWAIAVNGTEIYAGGHSTSSNSWDTAGVVVGTFTHGVANDESFVVEIADGSPGSLTWLMWIGGRGYDRLAALAVNGDEIYATGYETSTGSLETAVSTDGTFSGSNEAYLVEITDAATPSLEYHFWIGTPGSDYGTSLAVNADQIFVGGYLGSHSSLETFSTILGTKYNVNNAGFVAEIDDGSPATYYWLAWIGGSGNVNVYALAVSGDEIYAGGNGGRFNIGTATDVGTNDSLQEGFVVEIADGSTPSINWRHWLGGNYSSNGTIVYALAVNGDEIYAGGVSPDSTSWETAGSTAGTLTNAADEGFVVEIADGSPPTLAWSMWLGGVAADIVYALAVNGDEIYAGGTTASSDSWDTAGSTVGTLTNTGSVAEGFVVEIGDGSPSTLDWRMWLGGVGLDEVRGLVVNGDEIYAGGYSNSSDSWDTAGSTAGTVTNTENPGEGFVVEIADGGPPTLAWQMFLGGDGQEIVYALAVNADEVYAGGYSTSSASWDTAGATAGTFTDSGTNEGFIVEIADGGPPTLTWRAWVGAKGSDIIYSLAVNSDAIYAGGKSISSASWDTFTSTIGTFTDAVYWEGFIVKLEDAATPTYKWRIWMGGDISDSINALAINSSEVYVGGTIPGTTALEGTFSGTRYNHVTTGFIAEIQDDVASAFNAIHFGTEF